MIQTYNFEDLARFPKEAETPREGLSKKLCFFECVKHSLIFEPSNPEGNRMFTICVAILRFFDESAQYQIVPPRHNK